MKRNNYKRHAPGRRVVLLCAHDKKEALAVIELLHQQVEQNCPEDEYVLQSLYIAKNGNVWFG